MDKQAFVAALAEFLVERQSVKSVQLECGSPTAKEWAALRATTPIQGYPTKAEAVKQLSEWLGIPMSA